MISSTTTTDQYWCDVTKQYLVTIEFLDNPSNLYVVVLDYITGAETVLTYTETVAGTGEFSYDSATGRITTGDTFDGDGTSTNSDKITITTELEYLQKTDITSNSNYDPEVLETAYDNAVMLARQNKDKIGRSLSLALSDTGEEMILPTKASLANSYLHFDENGDPEAQQGYLPRVYDPEFTYLTNDIVPYNGDLWIAAQDIPQTDNENDYDPGDDTDYWRIYVGRFDFWDADVPYPKDAITSYGDATYEGTLVRSLQDDNIGHTPNLATGASDSWWEIVQTGGAVKVEGTVGTAGVSQFDLVYFDNGTDDGDTAGDAGKLVVGDNSRADKAILTGFALTEGVLDDVIEVQSKGILSGFPASTFTAGVQYFLGSSGGITTRGDIEYNEYIVSVGVAIDDTTLDVNIGLPEPNRSYDNGLEIGAYVEFATYKDRTAQGLYVVDYDNALSQANYPILFAEIGHKWNDAHVDAGDTDLSGSSTLFYPTPPPSFYSRVGIPDSGEIDSTSDINTSNETITLSEADYNKFKRMKYYSDSYNGVPVYLKLESGSLPTGLSENTVYYLRFTDDGNYYVKLYTSEANAIDDTSAVNITATATGTFRLTQEGIVLDDKFQGHYHQLYRGNTGGSDDGWQGNDVYTPTHTNTGVDEISVKEPTDDGDNGTPRTTNETRPKTAMMFKYVKAEYVTTAGEPISALRYDTGDVSIGNLQNQDITITHNLNEDITSLNIELWVKSDDSNNKYSLAVLTTGDTETSKAGYSLQEVDTNSFKVFTGDNGIYAMKSSSNYVYIGNSEGNVFYKVVVTKPNLVSTVFDTTQMPKEYDIETTNTTVTLPLLTGVLQTREYSWINGDGTAKIQFSVPDNTDTYSTSDYEGEGEGHIKFIATNGVDGLMWKVVEYEDTLPDDFYSGWDNVVKGANGKFLSGTANIYVNDYTESNVYTLLNRILTEDLYSCTVHGTYYNGTYIYSVSRVIRLNSSELRLETARIDTGARSNISLHSDGSGSWNDTNACNLVFAISNAKWNT